MKSEGQTIKMPTLFIGIGPRSMMGTSAISVDVQ